MNHLYNNCNHLKREKGRFQADDDDDRLSKDRRGETPELYLLGLIHF